MADLTYRGNGPWGTGKGARLTKEEVDTNFWTLEEKYNYLLANPVMPYQIEDILVNGDQMTVVMNDYVTTFGPFTLPTVSFRSRGTWAASTEYLRNDTFLVDGSMYLVLQNHTSDLTFDPDASNIIGAIYQLMFQFDATAYSLLTDVDMTGLADGNGVIWDATAGMWLPFAYIQTIEGLGGTNIVTPTEGDVLTYVGGEWINQAPAGAGGPALATIEVWIPGAPVVSVINWGRVTSATAWFAMPQDLSNSVGVCGTAPSGGDAVFTLFRGATNIGSVTFPDGMTTATFVFLDRRSFDVGDFLQVVAAADMHGIQNVAITFEIEEYP